MQTSPPQGGNAPSAGAVTSSQTAPGRPPHLLKLPLLEADGSNYAFWKCRVETVFTFYDLWSVVDGSFIKPGPAVDADGAAMWKTKNESA
jgi:hypothetical protein